MSFPATLNFRSAHSGQHYNPHPHHHNSQHPHYSKHNGTTPTVVTSHHNFNEKAYNYQLFICGSEKESAAAWLAAAVSSTTSPKLGRKSSGGAVSAGSGSNLQRKISNPLMVVNGNCFSYVANNNNSQNKNNNKSNDNGAPTAVNIAVNQTNGIATIAKTANKNNTSVNGFNNGGNKTTTITISAAAISQPKCSAPSAVGLCNTSLDLHKYSNTDSTPIVVPSLAPITLTHSSAISIVTLSPTLSQTSFTSISSASTKATPTISTTIIPVPPTIHIEKSQLSSTNISSSSPPPVIITTTNQQQQQKILPQKLLQPFGNRGDRVRRTSILRSSAPLVGLDGSCFYEKKNVRFADSMGKQLESVRYFANSPNPIKRRFSSNTPPTFITNFNSPWNIQPYGSKSLNDLSVNTNVGNVNGNHLANNSRAVSSELTPPTPITRSSSFGGSTENTYHNKLAPHYELVASNFASPSLQFNFESRLAKQSVLLHSMTSAETTIYGVVSVTNLHFTKRVTVRYTFNEWTSYIERDGTYMLGSHSNNTDKFSFVIYARPEEFQNNSVTSQTQNSTGADISSNNSSKDNDFYQKWGTWPRYHPLSSVNASSTTPCSGRLCFAIRYVTGDDREYWDNNDGRNYCLSLKSY